MFKFGMKGPNGMYFAKPKKVCSSLRFAGADIFSVMRFCLDLAGSHLGGPQTTPKDLIFSCFTNDLSGVFSFRPVS